MNYIEIDCTVVPLNPGRDILMAELAERGFESFVETETGLLAYIPQESFLEEAIESIALLYQQEINISFQKKIIEDENWNKQWESNFQPIVIDGRCTIRAPFHPSPKAIDYDIVIEPKMSFGTGHHETTRLMIQKLLELDVDKKSLLDMGCGTGVLAILASKRGATPITAIDIDEWAYINTVENVGINSISNIKIYKGNAQIIEGDKFYFILANINRNILLEDMPNYYQSLDKGGNLIMSGFLESDIAVLCEKAKEIGLDYKDQAVVNNWSLLHFVKK